MQLNKIVNDNQHCYDTNNFKYGDKINSAMEQSNQCLINRNYEGIATWKSYKPAVDALEEPSNDAEISFANCAQLMEDFRNDGGKLAYTACLHEVNIFCANHLQKLIIILLGYCENTK